MSEPNLASSVAVEGSHVALTAQPGQEPGQDSVQEPGQAQSSGALETIALDAVTARAIAGAARQGEPLERLQRHLAGWAAEYSEINTIEPAFVEALMQQTTVALETQQQQWQDEQAALQAELQQARSLSHEQIDRIRHLEQALDQSLASLSEMRLQMVDQHLLEAQLASTEDISNIQQQAIARLKLQLSQQQQALTAQLSETQARDRSLQTLLGTMETLTQAQQQALKQLRTQMASDRAEVQAYQQRFDEQQWQDLSVQQQTSALESDAQTLTDATVPLETQALVNLLLKLLSDRQSTLEQLETELQQAHLTLQEQQAWLARLQQSCQVNASTAGTTTPAIAMPEAVTLASPLASTPGLVTAHARIAALEIQATKQTTTQAMLRHACQELEEERDRQQARLTELESQTAEMQEQILRQAQQASEYETAIQHWKDRCFSSQSGILKLQALLDQALPDRPAALAALLAALLAAADEAEPGSPTLHSTASTQREKVDLPDFLLRRRHYKRERS